MSIKSSFILSIDQFFESCHNFRIFCLKFVNFCTIDKQITICSIVMQAWTEFLFCHNEIKWIQLLYVLILVLVFFQELKCLFSYYQCVPKNSYLIQTLLDFDRIRHLEMKNLIFYQIQFHNVNTHTCRYQHF